VHPTVRSRCESRVEVSILIADDQAPARAGFKMILETSPELHVIAEAHHGAQAVEAARRTGLASC
jgi:DNA-binding NarL/FixJ family response regulator